MNRVFTIARFRLFSAFPAKPERRTLALLIALCFGFNAAGSAQEPALDYLQHCAGCHMENGAGSERNGVPDMRHSIGHFTRLPKGRAFLVQVAGVAQAPLDDGAVAALLNWMLPEFSKAEIATEFTPYTAQEINQLRATRPGDLSALREQVVSELATQQLNPVDY